MSTGNVRRGGLFATIVAAVICAVTASIGAVTMVETAPVSAASNEGCYWIYYNGWYYICPPPPPKPGGGGGNVTVMSLYYPGVSSSPTRPPSYVPPIPSRDDGATGDTSWACDWYWTGRSWVIPCELPPLPAGYAAVLY
jgi:hypothetical protein